MNAAYVAFGRSTGYMHNGWLDVHGAGSQRSDPKSGDPSSYPTGHGPQGDAVRIYNYTRCVRGGDVTSTPAGGSGVTRSGMYSVLDTAEPRSLTVMARLLQASPLSSVTQTVTV